MPTLRWLTRDDDVRAAEKVPYRLLEEVPELGYGDRDAGNMLIQGDLGPRKVTVKASYNGRRLQMLRKITEVTVVLGVVMQVTGLATAQDFNYVPGWVNTYNHSQVGRSEQSGELPPCRFDMLPRSEQQRLHDLARAKVAEVGKEAAMPWIDRQSETVIAQMVEAGTCRSN